MNQPPLALLLLAAIGTLAGCSGGGDSAAPAAAATTPAVPAAQRPAQLRVSDVTGRPIAGAVITVTAGEAIGVTTTGDDGIAPMSDMPTGEVTLAVTAAGFEPVTNYRTRLPGGVTGLSLRATGAWAIGRAIVLGTRALERASDGSTLTFSVDVAVIGERSEALETLTRDAFEVAQVDCGWGGGRDCASDSAGNATGRGGVFLPEGPAQSFGLQPPSARRPYLVSVVAERSNAIRDWDTRIPALKTFFMMVGGNDAANLASVETIEGSTSLMVLGPFTSDGRTYLDAVDRLAGSAGERPELLESLLQSIDRTAAARSGAMAGAEPTVLLVLPTPWMTVEEVAIAVEAAQRLGVRISSVGGGEYGLPEMAVRTGGFVAEISDQRQLGMVFGALDALLAGTMPHYRMQFRLRGIAPDTFVSGGNVKVWLRIRVPTSLPNHGVTTSLDVAIP